MTVTNNYSQAITIVGREGKHTSDAQDIPNGGHARAFVDSVTEALNDLKKKKTGAALHDAIDASNHNCIIFRGGGRDASTGALYDNCAQADPPGTQAEVNCSIVAFRPRQRNIPVMGARAVRKEARPVGVHGLQTPEKANYKIELARIGEVKTTAQAAAE